MIRKAKPQDVDAIVSLAIESVTTISPIPQLRINREAIKDTVEMGLQPAHFLWVSDIDGVIVGAVGATVQPSFWFDKLSCSVLLHYSRAPGEWAKLMREFSRWCKSRSGIKMATIELEEGTDPRLIQFMARLGFDRVSTNVSYVRNSQ